MMGSALASQVSQDLHTLVNNSSSTSMRGFRFASSDIVEIQSRIKYMSFIDYVRGKEMALQVELQLYKMNNKKN